MKFTIFGWLVAFNLYPAHAFVRGWWSLPSSNGSGTWAWELGPLQIVVERENV